MSIEIVSPSWARLIGYEGREKALEPHCTYRDLRVGFELRRIAKSPWQRQQEDYADKVADLKAKQKVCLLRQDEDGALWIPAGLAAHLGRLMRDEVVDRVARPEARPIPWAKALDREPRPYQREMVRLLLEHRHVGAEIATGLGKTLIYLMACRELGLRALLTSPFGAIAEQTYREFRTYLGKAEVGLYGGGRHDVKQRIIISTAQALAKVEPGTPAWESLSARGLFGFDEAHLAAADTLKKICFGLAESIPYRLYLSGSQIRTDGLQLLLQALTGDLVLRMNVEQGVAEGYLAKPIIRILEIEGHVTEDSDDVQRLTRKVIYHNPVVLRAVGEFTTRMVSMGRPVLILVDEVDQLQHLLPHLRAECRFAHACTDRKTLTQKVPEAYRSSDPLDLVDRFNRGEFPVLVGTSCIGTGVDVRVAGAGVWLAGGKAEVALRQGVGRMTRLAQGKNDFVWLDVDAVDSPQIHRHALEREQIYKRIYPDVQRVRWS